MKVRNVSGRTRGVIPPYSAEFMVEPGETVEVDDALGKSMCQQPRNWQPVHEAATDEQES